MMAGETRTNINLGTVKEMQLQLEQLQQQNDAIHASVTTIK